MNDKINKLKAMYMEKYADSGNPEVAASFAIEDFMNIAKHQMQYFDQLVDEEIEDLEASRA